MLFLSHKIAAKRLAFRHKTDTKDHRQKKHVDNGDGDRTPCKENKARPASHALSPPHTGDNFAQTCLQTSATDPKL